MKKLVVLLSALIALSGCAMMPTADETAFLNSTPHEICARPHVAARYSSNDECKQDVSVRQTQVRNHYENRRQASERAAQTYYQQQYNYAQPTNCITTEWMGQLRTRCQ